MGSNGRAATGSAATARPSLWLVAALLVAQQVVLTLVHYAAAPALGLVPGSAPAISLTIIGGAIVIGLAVAADLRRPGRGPAVLLRWPRRGRVTVVVIVLAMVIAQLPLLYLAATGRTVWQSGGDADVMVGEALRGPSGALWLVIATVFIAPVIEEVLYRGYLVGSLIDRLPAVVTVLVSAVLFVTLHAEASNLVAAFCLGIATAICAVLTRSIVPGLIVHVAGDVTPVSSSIWN